MDLLGGVSHSTLQGFGDPRSQFSGRDNRVNRAHPAGAFYGMYLRVISPPTTMSYRIL